jgi:Zn-dependent membrane protease YugP
MGYFDIYYIILVVPTLLYGFYTQQKIKATYAKFSKEENFARITGAQAARQILDKNGLENIKVKRTGGLLNDYYNPLNSTVNLSSGTYDGSTISAVGVAAHEVGHAIQHAKGYKIIMIRNAIAPAANIASNAFWALVAIGFALGALSLVRAGIILFLVVVIFQIVTVPVEFDASKRALITLNEYGMVTESELPKVKKVLKAAGMTYVAATIMSIANLIRLVLISRDDDRD